MPKSYEEISKANANQNGKTDANLANDSIHLGGIEAGDYATKAWVQEYHGDKESSLKQYIDQQDTATLNTAKEYTNAAIRNQDFSNFAEIDDLQALNTNLTNKINTDIAGQKSYTDQKTQAIVDDVNANFEDVGDAIDQLNDNVSDLFQSVSDGKELIAEAITDKGVTTSATASFETMADNIGDINTNQGMIVIPDGYMNTNDATATADKIFQGYTAYVKGNKIHGTYIPSEGGGGSIGGVILGEDEVVASKIYGETGVLTGGHISTEDSHISFINSQSVSRKIALVCTGTLNGNYAIADRKLTENVDNEIVIYNITSTTVSHKDYEAKYSYTYSELGIQGEVRCIAASPLSGYGGVVQISIGTSVAIYSFYFNPKGNNGNGSIGEANAYSNKQKYVIENPCNDYNSITYSNTEPNTFAYYSQNRIHIIDIAWSIDKIIEWTNVEVSIYNNSVAGLFRFSANDRFLTYAPWGYPSSNGQKAVYIMLLNNFSYVIHQIITETTTATTGWVNGQIAINSAENFMILNGKPYTLSYSLEDKTITYTKQSDTTVIPYDEGNNESLYACFSNNDKYVFATSFAQTSVETGIMDLLGCYKVNYAELNSEWELVSSLLKVSVNSNGLTPPAIDLVNNRVLAFYPRDYSSEDTSNGGFYYYYSDPNVKEIIGLSYNGNIYIRTSM